MGGGVLLILRLLLWGLCNMKTREVQRRSPVLLQITGWAESQCTRQLKAEAETGESANQTLKPFCPGGNLRCGWKHVSYNNQTVFFSTAAYCEISLPFWRPRGVIL